MRLALGSPKPNIFKCLFCQQAIAYIVEGNNTLLEDSIYQQYLDWTIQDQINLDFFRPFVDINTDQAFAAPTDLVARSHVMAGNRVFLYQVSIRYQEFNSDLSNHNFQKSVRLSALCPK